jgi:Plasmid pRiA4b ORF-3-like protein
VAHETGSHESPDGQTPELEQLMAAVSSLNMGEMKDVLQRVLAAQAPLANLFDQMSPPSRRRTRRAEVGTYRVRVDLTGTKPPLWRRLELASDLFLDQVHEIIQAAFGWTDGHLHQFSSGPARYGPETEHYLCPFQVEERETGFPRRTSGSTRSWWMPATSSSTTMTSVTTGSPSSNLKPSCPSGTARRERCARPAAVTPPPRTAVASTPTS